MRKPTFFAVRVRDTHRWFPSAKTLLACLVFLCGLLIASTGWAQITVGDKVVQDVSEIHAGVKVILDGGTLAMFNSGNKPWIKTFNTLGENVLELGDSGTFQVASENYIRVNMRDWLSLAEREKISGDFSITRSGSYVNKNSVFGALVFAGDMDLTGSLTIGQNACFINVDKTYVADSFSDTLLLDLTNYVLSNTGTSSVTTTITGTVTNNWVAAWQGTTTINGGTYNSVATDIFDTLVVTNGATFSTGALFVSKEISFSGGNTTGYISSHYHNSSLLKNNTNVTWTDAPTITVTDSDVYADTAALNGYNIILEGNGTLYFTNDARPETSKSLYNYGNITYDKYGDTTSLNFRITPDALIDGLNRGQLYGGKISSGVNAGTLSGTGTIEITTCGNMSTWDSSSSFDGYFVAVTGDQTGFIGDTEVKLGTLMLVDTNLSHSGDSTVQYGSGALEGTMNIYKEQYIQHAGYYEVLSGGQLAFATFAAGGPNQNVLNVGELNIGVTFSRPGAVVGNGARLWIQTGNIGLGDRIAMEVNANAIKIASDTKMWYYGVSGLLSDGAVKIILNSDNIMIDGHAATQESLKELFGKPLVNVTVADDLKSLEARPITLEDFAIANEISGNTLEAARALDQVNFEGILEGTINQRLDHLYNQDRIEVTSLPDDLGRGWGLENLNLLMGHYGTAGSSFFMGSMNITPDVSGLLGMTIRAQSYEQDETPSSSPTISRKWEFWGMGAFTNMDARGYTKKGSKYDGYRVNRPGFLGGVQRVLSDTTSGGILFAYSSPDMKQEGLYDFWDGGYRTTIDMTDFQFALHFCKRFGEQWEFDVFLGGGSQWLDWHRMMRDDDKYYSYRGKSTGNTVTFTMYLARAFELTSQLDMRAIVGLDSEHSWIFGFEEDGTTVAVSADNLLMEMVLQPYEFKKIQYSRNTVRAGLRFSHQSAKWRTGSNYQIFYGHAVDRDEVASVDICTKDGKLSRNVKGLAVGRNSLTMGANVHVFLDKEERLVFQMDYNAILYERMTTQNVAMSLALQF